MLFTPRMKGTQIRVEMDIVKTDIPRGRWSKIVTESKTGKRWLARGASCNQPRCMCDATIEPVKLGKERC